MTKDISLGTKLVVAAQDYYLCTSTYWHILMMWNSFQGSLVKRDGKSKVEYACTYE